jgi:hypothetical protein
LVGRPARPSGHGSGHFSQQSMSASTSFVVWPKLAESSAVKSPASRLVPATAGVENMGLASQNWSSSPKAESWSGKLSAIVILWCWRSPVFAVANETETEVRRLWTSRCARDVNQVTKSDKAQKGPNCERGVRTSSPIKDPVQLLCFLRNDSDEVYWRAS